MYTEITERIPFMVGFNFPTFGLLDYLSLEIEYFKAPFINDYYNFQEAKYSPIPRSNADYDRTQNETLPELLYARRGDTTLAWSDYDVENYHIDDVKWSVNLRKTFLGNAVVSAQIANDHYRPGVGEKGSERYNTAFSKVSDYYMMLRVGYIF